MAVYLTIRRIEMTDRNAVYEYGPSDGVKGLLEVDQATGEITVRQAIPGDNGEAHFARAAHKLRKHMEDGELPEKTFWAS